MAMGWHRARRCPRSEPRGRQLPWRQADFRWRAACCAWLSDLEHMVLLAAPARRLGRTGHVELLLLLGDVGQDRAQARVDDGDDNNEKLFRRPPCARLG